jgi:uncharacterized protein YejL (UPF0352 family)
MKRCILVVFFFILLISTFFILIPKDNKISSPVASIEKAFGATGAQAVSSEVYIRGTAEGETALIDEAKQKQLIFDIIDSLAEDIERAKPTVEAVDNDIVFGLEADYIIDNDRNISIAILNTVGEEQQNEAHVSVSLTSTSNRPDMKATYSNLIDVLDKNNISYDVNLRITGSIDGNLEDDELDTMYRTVFAEVGANKVEGIDDNGLVSVSAFSPSIGNAVKVNGKSVNLNVATRYNSYEGKTYIWLATPVITTEY